MAWYLFEPEKKPPFAPDAGTDAGDFLRPFTVLCIGASFGLCVGGLIALLFGFKILAGWSVALGVLLGIIGGLLSNR